MFGFSRTNTINQFSLMSCECTDRLFGYLASVVLCLFVVTLPLSEVVASLCLFAAVLQLLCSCFVSLCGHFASLPGWYVSLQVKSCSPGPVPGGPIQ